MMLVMAAAFLGSQLAPTTNGPAPVNAQVSSADDPDAYTDSGESRPRG